MGGWPRHDAAPSPASVEEWFGLMVGTFFVVWALGMTVAALDACWTATRRLLPASWQAAMARWEHTQKDREMQDRRLESARGLSRLLREAPVDQIEELRNRVRALEERVRAQEPQT